MAAFDPIPSTDTILNQLYQCSFRNVEFEVTDEDTQRARSMVVHEYPNSDNYIVEDLGNHPAQLTLHAFVHGNAWEQLRDNLMEALDEGGSGLLVHPSFGRVLAYVMSYAISENKQKTLLRTDFDIVFLLEEKQNIAKTRQDYQSSIEGLYDSQLDKQRFDEGKFVGNTTTKDRENIKKFKGDIDL